MREINKMMMILIDFFMEENPLNNNEIAMGEKPSQLTHCVIRNPDSYWEAFYS
jgi:hypothetical protein